MTNSEMALTSKDFISSLAAQPRRDSEEMVTKSFLDTRDNSDNALLGCKRLDVALLS